MSKKHLALDAKGMKRALELLVERRYPGAEKAADFFDDLRDGEGL